MYNIGASEDTLRCLHRHSLIVCVPRVESSPATVCCVHDPPESLILCMQVWKSDTHIKLSLMVTLVTITTKYGLEWPCKTKQGLNHNQGIKAALANLKPPNSRGQREKVGSRPCIL